MAKAYKNDLFIGTEYMPLDGRDVKHPGLLARIAPVNHAKTQDEPIQLIGLDIETNHITGEMKLLGVCIPDATRPDGWRYGYYTSDFVDVLEGVTRYALENNYHLAYWNKLDPYIILKEIVLKDYTEEREQRALDRFGRVSGEYNSRAGAWTVDPVASVECKNGEFGIMTAIRSCIKLFRLKDGKKLKSIWAYDIAGLYGGNLGTEAGKRFDWYSKVDESAHLVDWDRFERDPEFREMVLLSNKLDARAAAELGMETQRDFEGAFGCYPKSLVSQGSLARAAITAVIERDLAVQGYFGKELQARKADEVRSISFMTFYDEWLERYDHETITDLYCLATEAYSGGYIESIAYGTCKSGWFADIASAYPGTIQGLEDLRGAEIITGTGKPPKPTTGYVFIRGKVKIPSKVNYHSITIKSPVNMTSNIRPVGTFYASYLWEEREFAAEQGATFTDERWYWVKTTGKTSRLASTCKEFIDLRKRLKAEGNSAEYMAKIASNSMYGIMFEAVSLHEDHDGEATRAGYRAGEFWNPIYASVITARTRLILAAAARAVEMAGGQPIILMTDSITWKGDRHMLPETLKLPFGESGVREVKTLGYFEPAEPVSDICCLGTGRYEYRHESGVLEVKRRGLNVAGVPEGCMDGQFTWAWLVDKALQERTPRVNLNVRSLISPGLARGSTRYTIKDIGRITEVPREVGLIVGRQKRNVPLEAGDPARLKSGLIVTTSINASGIYGGQVVVDGTLPRLRTLTMQQKPRTRALAGKDSNRSKVARYRKRQGNEERRKLYTLARELGATREEAKRAQSWSETRIRETWGGL